MTPKGQQKKKEIIEAAIEIIATQGIDVLTFDSIASSIGVGKSNVVYHYANKQDIVAACVELIVIKGLEVIKDRLNEKGDNIQEYLHGNIQWLEKYPKHAPIFMYFLYVATFDLRYKELFQKIRLEGQNRISLFLISEGVNMPVKMVKRTSVTIQNLITSALIELHTTLSDTKEIEERLFSEVEELILKAQS